MPSIVFFGSFQEHSATVLQGLLNSSELEILGVVTTPPHSLGRDKVLTPNPVQVVAEAHQIPVFTFSELDSAALARLPKPDYLITAGYGKLIPESWLAFPHKKSLNLHFSLLPDFRGANPAEWLLLFGQEKTGITLIEMSPHFDTGDMLAQAEIELEKNETRETVYKKLYELGAVHLPTWLSKVEELVKITQQQSIFPYSGRFRRDDASIDWNTLSELMNGVVPQKPALCTKLNQAWEWCDSHGNVCGTKSLAVFLARASRALHGFPSLWTLAPTSKGPKRLKIHLATTEHKNGKDYLILNQVQLEGQQIAAWTQIKNAITN